MAVPATSTSHASNYYVFLSFRGSDTRYGFTGNLYKALTDKGIYTFIDDENLRKGDDIRSSLVNSIRGSKIAIIMLSKDYASSTFCLDELSTIIHCAKINKLLVIPVFYKVDPSNVRHQRGSYGDALAKHEERFKHDVHKLQMLQKWKEDLRQVADLSGYHIEDGDEYEYKFIESIVNRVSQEIDHPARLYNGHYLVGLKSRVARVKKLLDVRSDDDGVHMVGIHGMGGVGKSTLARAVYNDLVAEKFDGSCYLENVREKSNKEGLEHLQKVLLQEILRDKSIEVTSWRQGASVIEDRLQRKKVLLILDDVDKQEQLQAILGRPYCFGPGSRVIITTRDVRLLERHDVHKRYKVNELNEDDALQLLTWKAFKKEKADPTYVHLLYPVLEYASGLPLALEVIGSHLSGTRVERWASAIEYYKTNPDKGIQGILKKSFKALDDNVKRVFLDIACCLKGYELTEVEYILSSLYDHDMKYVIELLVEKSLIKVDLGRVKMHDLIQDMGRRIDLKKSDKQRRRLWLAKDIVEVLKHNKGTSRIEIICLDVPTSGREEIIEWDGNGFKKMKNLKILIIRNAKFSEGSRCLPNSLRVMEWWGYPSNCLPSDFQPPKLVVCKLPLGCLTSFELNLSSQMSKNLTVLKFDECKSLTRIPDLSDFSNLEKLSFEFCSNLVTVNESIGHLDKLKEITALGCRNLVSFPPIHLTSLEHLDLSFTGLESFPEISGKMENIRYLKLHGATLKELPFSFVNLVRLQKFSMWPCGCVVKLPISILMMPELTEFEGWHCEGMKLVKEEENEETMGSVVSSNLNRVRLQHCNLGDNFFSIIDFTGFAHVTELDLSGNNFTFLPECIKEFQSLRRLNVSDCEHLQEIRGVPPNIKVFYAKNCKSLTSSSTSMVKNQELYEAGMERCCLPGEWIPEWFDKKSRGASTCFWFRNKLPTNILCLLIQPARKIHYGLPDAKLCINGRNVRTSYTYYEDKLTEMDQTYIFKLDLKKYLSRSRVTLREEWNHVEITYGDNFVPASMIKGSGIHLLKGESGMEDIRFSDPMCSKRKLDDYLNTFES